MAIPQKMLTPLLQRKTQEKAVVPPPPKDDDEDDDFVGLGVNGTMAITQKLLAVNRGLEDPDDRDSWAYKTVLTPDKLFAERIRMDAGKARQAVMRRAIRTRSLQGLMPNAFGGYTEGMIKSHPLSMPLEEINPMHIVEQARRVTAMGPGGLSSSDSITEDAQAISASQFGFISPLEGPESEKAGLDVRLATNVRIGSDGKLYQMLRNARTGKLEWVSHVKASESIVQFPD